MIRSCSTAQPPARRSLGRLATAGAVLVALPVTVLSATGQAQAAGARTYFVSANGSDSASGTSPDQAWSSLSRASKQSLGPGDKVLLARGSTFRGTLTVRASGTAGHRIRVGAYGTGNRPVVTKGGCVQVPGSYVTVRGLTVKSCSWGGVSVRGDHVRVVDNAMTGNVAGVKIDTTATGTRVIGNHLYDNDRLSPNTPGSNDDHGAYGVEVLGDRSVIKRNRIHGHHAPSPDYGVDGSAIEVYGARGTSIHHNVAWDNKTFTELGNKESRGTTYGYNVVRSSLPYSNFITTRGTGDYWGPVYGTVARHNSVRLTGKGSETFWCGGICGPKVLKLYDNILVAPARIGFATAPRSGKYAGHNIGGARNVYFGSGLETRKQPGDRVVNPGFANLTTLALSAGSKAIDRAADAKWKKDAVGGPARLDGDGDGRAQADTGALERARP